MRPSRRGATCAVARYSADGDGFDEASRDLGGGLRAEGSTRAAAPSGAGECETEGVECKTEGDECDTEGDGGGA